MSMISRQKLKPCPFCGGEAVILAGFEEHIWIFCEECKAEISAHTTEAEAIEAWNKRAEQPAIVGIDGQKLIEELKNETYSINENDYEDYWQGVLEGLNRSIKKVESQPPADQWIPCSERLPDKEGIYWVTPNWHTECVLVCAYSPETRKFEDEYGRINALAWMPCDRPKPYKEGEKE